MKIDLAKRVARIASDFRVTLPSLSTVILLIAFVLLANLPFILDPIMAFHP